MTTIFLHFIYIIGLFENIVIKGVEYELKEKNLKNISDLQMEHKWYVIYNFAHKTLIN